MGRLWLVAALLLPALPALAAPEDRWACPGYHTLPGYESHDVPTNAQSIEVDSTRSQQVPIKVTSLGDLKPNTTYELDEPAFLHFKTGSHPDLRAPEAPKDVYPRITIRADRRLNTIELPGTYDVDDTALIELDIAQGAHHIHNAVTMPSSLRLCGYPGSLEPGPATVTVWSLDLAAHRSEPFVAQTDVIVDDTDVAYVCNRRHGGIEGPAELIYVAGFLCVALLVLAAKATNRTDAPSRNPEAVMIPLGESVARLAMRQYLVCAMLAIAAIITLGVFDHVGAAVTLSPIAIALLFALIKARRVVARFECPVRRLERHGNWLLVDHTFLYCGRAWKRASKLPMAIVKPVAVLAVLLLGTSHAEAKRIACDPTAVMLPRADGTQLPRNALAWTIPAAGQITTGPGYRTDPLNDNPHAVGPADTTPPGMPRNVMINVERETDPDGESVSLRGDFDTDTAVVLLDIVDADGRSLHLVTTPDRWLSCSKGIEISYGNAYFTVTGVDIAGNRSEPFTTELYVKPPSHGHVRCGVPLMGLFIIAPFALLGLLVVLLVVALVRRTRIRNTPGDVIPLLLAENVARLVARNYLIKSALGVVAVIALLGIDYDISAIIVAPFAFGWLCKLALARAMVSVLDKPVGRVERREDWLYADKHILRASRRIFNAAERARVPTASAGLQRHD